MDFKVSFNQSEKKSRDYLENQLMIYLLGNLSLKIMLFILVVGQNYSLTLDTIKNRKLSSMD
jgi:hypothetical protein